MKQIDVRSVENAMELIGNKCTLPIIACLMGGPKRFSELQKQCVVCPRTLSARLDELSASGLISKNKPGEYEVTKKGQELRTVIEQISAWKA